MHVAKLIVLDHRQYSPLVQKLSPDLVAWMLTVANLHTLEKEQLEKWSSHLIL